MRGHVPLRGAVQADRVPHQAEQRVDVVSLAQQQGELLFLKGRQQLLRELLTLYRRNADGGVLLGAYPDDWDEQLGVKGP